MCSVASELRHLGQFRGPGGGEGRAVGFQPVGVVHDLGRTVLASVGRISRSRGSMVPSSSIRLVAGTCTAPGPSGC